MSRQQGQSNQKKTRPGYAFLHHAVDDHSRLAYSEILADEKKETVAAFWIRARSFFNDHGIVRVLIGNHSNGSGKCLQNAHKQG